MRAPAFLAPTLPAPPTPRRRAPAACAVRPSSSSSQPPPPPPRRGAPSPAQQRQRMTDKVHAHMLQEEQTPFDAPPSNTPPPPLPLQLDLLNYHARRHMYRSPQRAASLFRRALQINSADGRAWLGLARLRVAAREFAEARRAFRDGVRACPNNAHLLQAWGVFEQKQRAVARAHGLFKAAVRVQPTHAPSWVALALWYQRYDKDFARARKCLQKATEVQPHNYYAWQVWAQLERSLGNVKQARAYFVRSAEVNANNAATFVAWACFEAAQNNLDMAIQTFEKAHKVSPKNVRAYVAHASVLERAGFRNRARNMLVRAMKHRPSEAGPRQMMAILEFRDGRVESAREMFESALELDRLHAPTWHAWACVELHCGDVERARHLFQHAIWASPQSTHAVRTWHAWATMEMQHKQFGAARRYFAHAMEIDHSNVAILTGMARLDAMTGDVVRARQLLEKCIQLKPSLRSTWKLYEDLELAYGSVHRARLVYERCVLYMRQVDQRLMVSDALPGDFRAGGMWIDALELSPNESAFEKIDEKDR